MQEAGRDSSEWPGRARGRPGRPCYTPSCAMLTRRRLLTRLAAALGAAVALPPALAPVVPTEARELLPARSACACGGGRVLARAPQTDSAVRTGRAQAVRVFENRVGWAYSPRWRK